MTIENKTHSGNRALQLEEPSLFELGPCGQTYQDGGRSAVDLPAPDAYDDRLGGLRRKDAVGLPGVSEPQVVRHFTRLSQKNYGIDSGLFPLGSCTMKHNPRLNERVARFQGIADLHPMQPMSTVQGSLELMHTLSRWLVTLTGMQEVTLSPAAGAQGELCGLLAVRRALEARGEGQQRTRVLVPDSAHGTNPATATACGYKVQAIPSKTDGRVDFDALQAALGDDVAAIMLTNPNTCGLYEDDIRRIADAVHECGGYFYCDGANFNAIMGRVKPADLGVDAMHINLHKTFSTPHGGGGPGSGPVVFSAALAPFAPLPRVIRDGDQYRLVEESTDAEPTRVGRLKAFHGQFGMFVRSLAFMLSHGIDGIRQASGDAVLSANYLRERLAEEMTPAYEGRCMHETLFDDRFLKDSGISTLDFAKALIDEGYHPMTVYFPLVVHGAMLIEPTESEPKIDLDRFAESMLALARDAKTEGAKARFAAAPRFAPRGRLDEAAAARKPKLTYPKDSAPKEGS